MGTCTVPNGRTVVFGDTLRSTPLATYAMTAIRGATSRSHSNGGQWPPTTAGWNHRGSGCGDGMRWLAQPGSKVKISYLLKTGTTST